MKVTIKKPRKIGASLLERCLSGTPLPPKPCILHLPLFGNAHFSRVSRLVHPVNGYGRDEQLPLLQIPLIIQDVVLSYNMVGDEALIVRRCIELMNRVAEVGEVLTILWHNQYRPDMVEFRCYMRVLAEAAARGAWGCSMRQLDDWWRGLHEPI